MLGSAVHTRDRGPQIQAYVVLMQISLLTFLPQLSETKTKLSNVWSRASDLIGQNATVSVKCNDG